MVVICISLMIGDIKHLFICLLVICMISWKHIEVLCFVIGLFICLILSCKSSLYILDDNDTPLSGVAFANIFSHSFSSLSCIVDSFLGLCKKFLV